MAASEKLAQVLNSRRSLLSVGEVAELLQVPHPWSINERTRLVAACEAKRLLANEVGAESKEPKLF
jgi:hypothetical protein